MLHRLVLIALACACTPRPLPGTIERRLSAGGVTRTYLLHAGNGTGPASALVLMLHGLGGSAAEIERRTRGTFNSLAERDGAVVVYPNAFGRERRWNDGWRGGAAGAALADDLGFLSALIDTVGGEFGVDRRRVFAAGFSNGAAMVYRLANERADLVAAVAPVGGAMGPTVAETSGRGAPVSIIGMHGTADVIVPFDRWIRDGVTAWTRRDGCPTAPTTSELPDADPDDGTRTRLEVFAPCAAGTAVAFYSITDAGHAWPGSGAWLWRGRSPRDFDAAVVIWDFFQKHPRR